MDNKKNDSEDCTTCTALCCGCFGILVVIGCAISYIVFGIMFLVQDYNVAHECENSSLWAYVLTAIILSVSRSGAKNTKDDQDNLNICVLVCLGLIELGLAIWGGVELWIKSCDSLTDTNIWKFALATFILQTFVASLLLVFIPLTFCIFAICNGNSNVEENINDESNNISYGSSKREVKNTTRTINDLPYNLPNRETVVDKV